MFVKASMAAPMGAVRAGLCRQLIIFAGEVGGGSSNVARVDAKQPAIAG